jgi:hypothetical protein
MKKVLVSVFLFVLIFSTGAHAALTNFRTYTAEGAGLSLDAVGLQDNVEGFVQAEIPVNAVIQAAYLYSASVWSLSPSPLPNVVFETTTLVSDASSRVDVGGKDANPASSNRWDVTSIVQSKVGGGSGVFDFSVKELGFLDGEILAVLYSIPSAPVRTAFIFDGELATTGDTFNINLSDGYDGSDAIFSLGISFGFQPSNQYSQIDVNGERLTTSAGGQDDGFNVNGGLITVGGIGDSTDNPADPFAFASGPRSDDELYNLKSFLKLGDNLITIRSLNPSNDDNVFFAALVVNGEASVNPVPEPGTLVLLGFGLLGIASAARRKFMK